MKRGILSVAALLAFAGTAQGAIPVGSAAPDIEFTDTWNDGGKTKLSDLLGSFVLLKFSATW